MNLSRRELLGAAFCTMLGQAQTATPRNVALYGREESLAPSIPLRAGPVTAEFEPGLGFLRYVRFADKEILRGAYVAVRDKVWGTVAPRVSNVTLESRADRFKLTFDVDCKEAGIDYYWQGVITGDSQGTIRFEMNGKARSTFQKNRIGFAVLHPLAECAGKECLVEKVDGAKEKSKFPETISPHQPFLGVRALTHQVEPGVDAEVRMEGDTFETEDHRNWTDGNFKTYCTPLALPFPVEIKSGTEIRQAVTITLKGKPAARRYRKPDEVAVELDKSARTRLPALGLQWNSQGGDPGLIRAAQFSHIRVDLRLWDEASRKGLDAASLNLPLEIAAFVSDNAESELAWLAGAAKNLKVARYLVFHQKENSTAEKWLRLAQRILKGPAPIGGGTNVYFTELNRERPAADALAVACYSVNPQVHAFDNQSMVENLPPQGEQVRSARRFLGTKPIAVTPISLRPRFNPQAVGPSGAPADSRFDPRQKSLFGAAWTIGSVKYLAEAGAASATYYETSGPAGIADAETIFPLYHALADIGEFTGADVISAPSSDPLRTLALALERRGQKRMLLANMTPEIQLVRLWDGWLGRRVSVKRLDEHSFDQATRQSRLFRRDPGEVIEFPNGRLEIALLPYGIARIDSV